MADKKVVLNLDDEPDIAALIEATLTLWRHDPKYECEVLTYYLPLQALEALSQREWLDLALINVIMPQLDGFTVAKRVRKMFPQCRIILQSSSEILERELEQAGADGYIRVPFEPKNLIEYVREQFRQQSQAVTVENGSEAIKMIIVESDADAAHALRYMLEAELKTQIAIFKTNQPALAAVETMQPDLIITDLLHEGEDGYALIRSIKARWPNRYPVMVVSAAAGIDRQFHEKAEQAGADAVIHKPFNPSEFLEKVKKIIPSS